MNPDERAVGPELGTQHGNRCVVTPAAGGVAGQEVVLMWWAEGHGSCSWSRRPAIRTMCRSGAFLAEVPVLPRTAMVMAPPVRVGFRTSESALEARVPRPSPDTGVTPMAPVRSFIADATRPGPRREAEMDLTSCPECGVPAEVTWRFVAKSTDCPVDHVQPRCIRQHTFLGPAASLLPDRSRRAVLGSPGTITYRQDPSVVTASSATRAA